jgi:hypothetical protein
MAMTRSALGQLLDVRQHALIARPYRIAEREPQAEEPPGHQTILS